MKEGEPGRERTVAQSGDDGKETCVPGVSVVVDADGVDVEYPCRFGGLDAEGGQGEERGAVDRPGTCVGVRELGDGLSLIHI